MLGTPGVPNCAFGLQERMGETGEGPAEISVKTHLQRSKMKGMKLWDKQGDYVEEKWRESFHGKSVQGKSVGSES